MISALSECFLVNLEQEKKEEAAKGKKNILGDIKEGFKYLWQEKTIFYLLVISAFVNFFLAGYNLLIPYTDVIYQGKFQGFYSKVMVAEAIGGIVGSFVFSFLHITDSINGFGVMGLGIILLAVLSQNLIKGT